MNLQNFNLPKLGQVKAKAVLVLTLALIGFFILGYEIGLKGFKIILPNKSSGNGVKISREIPKNRVDVNFSLFWRVWDALDSAYFDKTKLDPSKMIYGAVKGMVEAIGDPYTVFLPPSENKVINEDLSGAFEGIGIQIGFKGSQLAVIAPLPDSPADKAGIKAGDFIVGIKDEKKKIDRGTVGINLPEAVQAIRGESGTEVTLALTRGGEDKPLIVTVKRAKIDVPSVLVTFVGPKNSLAQIKLTKFGGETKREWDKAVENAVAKKDLKGVILDLRNNPGGYLQGAVDIASDFFKSGVVVIEENAKGEKHDFKINKANGKLLDLPVVVLINGGSASASEILAGALRDARTAKLIGETSFGKGTIQEPQEIDNGAGLHVTIAKWLTPSGFWVNEKGLEPDIKIKDDPKTEKIDEQLEAAIKAL